MFNIVGSLVLYHYRAHFALIFHRRYFLRGDFYYVKMQCRVCRQGGPNIGYLRYFYLGCRSVGNFDDLGPI